MYRREILSAGLGTAGAIALGPAFWTPASAATGSGYRLTGPYSHRNLSIYLIHRGGRNAGPAPVTPVPMNLREALEQGTVKVLETGNVRQLVVRNDGGREVFIQAGDIVKGGKQDRVLTVSMIVPPKSGPIPIGAFCVEQGRWARRSGEKLAEFSTSTARLPSRAGKLAMMERANQPRTERPAPLGTGRNGLRPLTRRGRSGDRQGRVWKSVRTMQARLSASVKSNVADRRSRSSLQLSLENDALAAALADYEKALGALLETHPDAVGYVFAIGSRINSGDEFESAGLFAKLWSRQLKAAATEALAEGAARAGRPPKVPAVAAFIERTGAARAASKAMPGGNRLVTAQTAQSVFMETRRSGDRWVHRSFVSRQ